MANKTISKVMLGLMTVMLLCITMVPVEAGFDEVVVGGVLVGGYVIHDTTDAENDVIHVDLDINHDAAEIARVTLTGIGGSDSWTGVIPMRNGEDTFSVPGGLRADRVLGDDYEAQRDPYDITLEVRLPGVDTIFDTGDDVVYTTAGEEIHVDSEIPTELRKPISADIFDIDAVEDEVMLGGELDIEVKIDADDDDVKRSYDDMKIVGELWDTEEDRLIDDYETGDFDVGDKTRLTKTLNFNVPRNIELTGDDDDRFEVVITVTADESTADPYTKGVYTYTFDDFEIEFEENSMYFSDVDLSSTSVDAGESLTIDVELGVDGDEDQSNIVILAEIDDLDAKVTGKIVTIAQGRYANWVGSMGIRSDARAGTYELEITATSEEGAVAKYTEEITIGGGVTTSDLDLDVTSDDELTLGSDGTVDFEFEITNDGTGTMRVELKTEGADAELSQDIITLKAGETETFTVTANEAGEITVFAEADGELTYETVTANAAGADVDKDEVVKVLQWIFAVIIIIAIILVIVWAVTKGRNGEGKKEAYY